jgi:hypothetical protein
VQGEVGAGVLDDFRALTLHRGGQREQATGSRDKGHAGEIDAFVAACREGGRPAVARGGHAGRHAHDVCDPRRGGPRRAAVMMFACAAS